MAYFTEQAVSPSECLNKIRSKYGERAKVLIQRTVRKGGILGIGSHEEVEMTGTYGMQMSGATVPAGAAVPSGAAVPAAADLPRPGDMEEEKRKILALVGKTGDPTLKAILKEVRDLSEKVDTKFSAEALPAAAVSHPSLARLEEDLIQNDFSVSYIKTLLERVRREFALEDLENYELVQRSVTVWIAESISIYHEKTESPVKTGRKKPRIIVLVGATGVGKTTTIIKLAALYGKRTEDHDRWQNSVRLITMDNYKIGGGQQIEKYGEIMEIPVSLLTDYDGLKAAIALYRHDVDFILIDTIGKSPRNYGELGDMKAVLEACGPRAEIHLCLASSTKPSDIRETLVQFAPFKYKAVIITKLDETSRVGNVISALSEAGKSVSFITTGQIVPSDIERASVMRFLLNLEGFTIDREGLSRRFGEAGNGSIE
jgi:flagellar biosynthesis protein FlhF